MSQPVWRLATYGLLTGGTSLSSYIYIQNNHNNSNTDFQRTLKLWTELGPIITHYRLIELKHKILYSPTLKGLIRDKLEEEEEKELG